ncbi:MAG: PAS domain S-box protein, partial [Leptolyngbyaceae cyanobacterium SL_7_1]|nr:PAS domain S-box protein [Leptolyngbyaceae cyanobacterium SL_7_1]
HAPNHSSSDPVSQSRRKPSLRILLTLPFLLQTIVPVALVGYLSFRNGQRAVNDLAAQLQAEVSQRVEQHLNRYFTAPRQINRLNQSAIQLGLLNPDEPTPTGRYFWQQMQVFSDISYINYTETTGQFVGVGRGSDGGLYLELSDPARPNQYTAYQLNQQGDRQAVLRSAASSTLEEARYAETVAAGKPIWTTMYQLPGDAPGDFSISCGIPIFTADRTLAGVVGVDLFLPHVSQFLRELAIAPSGRVLVIERDGSVLASSSEALPFRQSGGQVQPLNVLDSPDEIDRATAEQVVNQLGGFEAVTDAQRFEFWQDGDRQFVQITPWQDPWGLDLLLLVTLPESAFMGQINANTRTTIALCLASLVGAIALGVWMARRLSRPISELSQASETLAIAAQRGFSTPATPALHSPSVRELDTLATAFNSMTAQLQHSFTTLESQNVNLQRTQTALAAAKEQLEAVINAVPGPISWVDAGGVYIGVNRHFAENWQLSQEAFVGKEVGFLQGSAQLADFTRQFLHSPEQSASQVIPLHLDNQLRYYLIAAQKYQQGQATVSVGIDITERETAKEALRIAEENYRSIFENALEGIFQSSPEGQFINVNPALAKIYGYDSPTEMMASITNIGEQLYVDAEKRTEFRNLLEKQGIVKNFEYRCYRKDGTIIWTEIDARVVKDSNDRILYYEGIVQDISDRKRREDELRRQLAELKIEIDQQKREKEVESLTASTYFQEVKEEMANVNLDEFWG